MTTAELRRAAGAMLRPKQRWLGKRARHYLDRPGWFEYGLAALSYLTERLMPPERRAMAEIAANGDLLMVGERTYIVAELSPAALDAIAAFDAQAADLEIDDEDCCGANEDDLELPVGHGRCERTEDDEPDHDNELDQHGFLNRMTAVDLPTVEQQLRAPRLIRNGSELGIYHRVK